MRNNYLTDGERVVCCTRALPCKLSGLKTLRTWALSYPNACVDIRRKNSGGINGRPSSNAELGQAYGVTMQGAFNACLVTEGSLEDCTGRSYNDKPERCGGKSVAKHPCFTINLKYLELD